MEKLGMGSALSVGTRVARAVQAHRHALPGRRREEKPIVLVGKGITFDTGGISLKPGDDLDMMKYDMCRRGQRARRDEDGRAAWAAAQRRRHRRRGREHAGRQRQPAGRRRQLDVGPDHRDPEHRRGGPAGAVRCAHLRRALRARRASSTSPRSPAPASSRWGTQTRACSPTTMRWPTSCSSAATDTGDRAWRMPLWDEYQDQLKSNFADMSNLGGRPAGAVTAACFLARFTARLQVGAPRHRRHRIGGGRRQGGDRSTRTAADRVPPGACRRRRRLNPPRCGVIRRPAPTRMSCSSSCSGSGSRISPAASRRRRSSACCGTPRRPTGPTVCARWCSRPRCSSHSTMARASGSRSPRGRRRPSVWIRSPRSTSWAMRRRRGGHPA